MTLPNLAPEFAAEVQAALIAEGYEDQARTIPTLEVERWEFDETVGMGYIRFARPSDPGYSAHLAAAVKVTIPCAEPHRFNIDVDHDGLLFGIELDGRRDVIAELAKSGAV